MLYNFAVTLFKCSVNHDKEKPRPVTKLKLVTNIKKHNQLYFGTLVLASYCYCGDDDA